MSRSNVPDSVPQFTSLYGGSPGSLKRASAEPALGQNLALLGVSERRARNEPVIVRSVAAAAVAMEPWTVNSGSGSLPGDLQMEAGDAEADRVVVVVTGMEAKRAALWKWLDDESLKDGSQELLGLCGHMSSGQMWSVW